MSWEADAYDDDASYLIEQDDEDVEDYDEIEPSPAKRKRKLPPSEPRSKRRKQLRVENTMF